MITSFFFVVSYRLGEISNYFAEDDLDFELLNLLAPPPKHQDYRCKHGITLWKQWSCLGKIAFFGEQAVGEIVNVSKFGKGGW